MSNTVDSKDYPNGGFPPIYPCSKSKPEPKIVRGYSVPEKTISIKTLLEKRRK